MWIFGWRIITYPVINQPVFDGSCHWWFFVDRTQVPAVNHLRAKAWIFVEAFERWGRWRTSTGAREHLSRVFRHVYRRVFSEGWVVMCWCFFYMIHAWRYLKLCNTGQGSKYELQGETVKSLHGFRFHSRETALYGKVPVQLIPLKLLRRIVLSMFLNPGIIHPYLKEKKNAP